MKKNQIKVKVFENIMCQSSEWFWSWEQWTRKIDEIILEIINVYYLTLELSTNPVITVFD